MTLVFPWDKTCDTTQCVCQGAASYRNFEKNPVSAMMISMIIFQCQILGGENFQRDYMFKDFSEGINHRCLHVNKVTNSYLNVIIAYKFAS